MLAVTDECWKFLSATVAAMSSITLAWLAHSPLGSGLSTRSVWLLTNMNRSEIWDIIKAVNPAGLDDEQIWELAIEKTQNYGEKYKLPITYNGAWALAKYLYKCYQDEHILP